MARRARRPIPDPRLGLPVELPRGDTGRVGDLVQVGEGLPCEGCSTDEAPRRFVAVEPAGADRDADLVDAGMDGAPRLDRRARVAGEGVGADRAVAFTVRRVGLLQQFTGADSGSRRRRDRELLAGADP